MNTPRSLLLALSALVLASVPALRGADETRPAGPAPGERRERMQQAGERMGEALGLSDDQKAKMQEINKAERAELQALRDSTSGDRETMRPKVQAIHEKYKAQRDALLTSEQRTKADAMREKGRERMEERRERMGKEGPGPGGPGGPGGQRRVKKGA